MGKFDLETVFLFSTADKTSYVTNVGGDSVPAGKTRFLTYIRIERTTAIGAIDQPLTAVGIGIVSFTTNASTVTSYSSLAATHEKIRLVLATISGATGGTIHDSMNFKEIKGSMEQPILSVAGGNFMILGAALAGPTATIKAQYFDE